MVTISLITINNQMLYKFLVVGLFYFIFTFQLKSQSILEDTIWYRNQNMNLYNIQFLNNDKFIIANGKYILNSESGSEIFKFEGTEFNAVIPYFNDQYFLRISYLENKGYIYKTDGLILVDSLEGIVDPSYFYQYIGDVSFDNKLFVTSSEDLQKLVIWDLNSKKIVSKIKSKDTTLKNCTISKIAFPNYYNRIFVQFEKMYIKPKEVPQFKTVNNIVIFDRETLDSIGVIPNSFSCDLSKDRKILAYLSNLTINIIDLSTMKVINVINEELLPTAKIKISDDKRYLIIYTPEDNYRLKIWDLETNKRIYSKYSEAIFDLDISEDNQNIVLSTRNAIINLKTNLILNSISNINSKDITLYPNPVNQKATIEFYSKIRNVEYSIINQRGSIVKKSLIMANTETLNKMEMDFSIFPSGIYFVNLFTGEANPLTIKIVKE